MGKHSGRNAFRTRLKDLGIEFDSEEALNDAFARFKELADKKHEIFDEDLQALVSESNPEVPEIYKLVSLKVCSETGEKPFAEVTLNVDGEEHFTQAEGGGPVDAAFQAIEFLVGSKSNLQLYSVNNITSGTDAQGEVTVRLEKDGWIVNGQGADTDIVVASARSYLNALNKLMGPSGQRAHPQHGDV
jgi:2-isopropylmalate synthase